MATCRKCEADVQRLVTRRIEASYPDLAEAGATFDLQFAFAPVDDAGDLRGSAMTDRGTPVLGKLKVISQADRVGGLADVRLTLDGDAWPQLTDGRRAALLDTLLCGLLVLRDGAGRVKLDDCGRPRLKVRPAEILVRGYYQIIDRHGEEALEAEGLGAAWERCVEQGLLTFREPEPQPAPVPEGPRESFHEYAVRMGFDWRKPRGTGHE